MTLYKLSISDLIVLNNAEQALREHNEHDMANDVSLLKGRIEYMLKKGNGSYGENR